LIIEFSLLNDTLFRYNALCLDDMLAHPECIARVHEHPEYPVKVSCSV